VTTLLVTDITSYKAAVIVRHLRGCWPRVRVVATDHRGYARYVHTRYAVDVRILDCKPEDGERYARALGELVAREKVDMVIPVNSKEVRTLVDYRQHLGSALDYMGASDIYRQLDDKALFAQLLDNIGLPTPRSHETLDGPLPLVVKPSQGSSAKGVNYLNSEEKRAALKIKLGSVPPGYVIQDFVDGEGIGFSGYFRDGQALVSYAHRRVGEYPISGGSSVVRERYPYDDLPKLEALVAQLLSAAPWSGFAMFELKRRGPSEFSFIECNPRVWGSMHQGLADGCDYFAPMFDPDWTSLSSKPADVRTMLLPLNLLASMKYLLAGKPRKAFDVMSGVRRQKADVQPLKDPLGFLALLLRRG
jgi:predicted ATP-grasp superfamily ATP-dependent carboligase